jgi:hypothetical protein
MAKISEIYMRTFSTMASWCREPLGESEFKEFFEGPSYIGSSAMTSQKKKCNKRSE